MKHEKVKLVDENGLRIDGRKPDQLRPVKMEVSVLKNADGSAYVEQGNTRVLAAVYGPREVHPKHLTLPDRAILRTRYHMVPYSTDERKSPAPTRREIELSKVIREALESVIFVELYPRTTIDVFIEVIQADAGTRTAGLMAASLALADAGIPMKDLIAAVAIGKVDGTLDMPIAMMPSLGEIVLLQLNGVLSEEEFYEALKLAQKGIAQLYEFEKQALMKKYVEVKVEEV